MAVTELFPLNQNPMVHFEDFLKKQRDELKTWRTERAELKKLPKQDRKARKEQQKQDRKVRREQQEQDRKVGKGQSRPRVSRKWREFTGLKHKNALQVDTEGQELNTISAQRNDNDANTNARPTI